MVCLITGGSRGIGFAVAEAFLRRGDSVAVTGTSSGVRQAAADLATRLQADSSGAGTLAPDNRIVPLVCDVRDRAAVEAAMQEVVTCFGGLDVLVNNAGVGLGAPIADLSEEEWNRIIDTNLTGVFHCCQAAIPHLRRRGGGWIINVSSLSTKTPFAGAAAYIASKAAVNAFTEAFMQEVRHENIRVSCVLPGSVATGFSGRTLAAGSDWKLQPEDVAHAIIDLVGHASRSLPSRVELRPSRPQKS